MLEQLDRIRGYATELLYRRLSLAGGEHLGALAPNTAVTLVGASYLTGEADAEEVLARVLEHARSGVLWFTYRRGFAAIAGTSFTSDASPRAASSSGSGTATCPPALWQAMAMRFGSTPSWPA